MKNILLLFAFLAVVFVAENTVRADNTVVTVNAEAFGASYELAIANALCEAVRQVNGTLLDSQREIASAIHRQTTSVNDETERVVDVASVTDEKLRLLTKGAVHSYQVDSCEQEENGWKAVLTVQIMRYETPGLSPDTRRKIAMTPFATSEREFYVGGAMMPASKVTEDLLSDFNMYFTQSRRFAVLTRQDNAALATEKALIASQSPIEELAKLGKTLGLDYLVVGTVKSLFIAAPEVKKIAISGAQKTVISRAFIDLDYRIVVVATSQIKWADRITIDLSLDEIATAEGDVLTLYSMLTEYASRGIAAALDNIYPMRAIMLLENGELLLDRGGSLLAPGMYFDVFKLGPMVYDPVNHEPLGQPEVKVALVQVTRVDSKLSYAALVPGYGQITADDVNAGLILRAYRMPAAPPTATESQAAPAQEPAARPVIRLPYDI